MANGYPPRPRPGQFHRPQGQKGLRRNDRIRAQEVRVIGPEGKNLGVLPTREALQLAQSVGLDLIEISPGATPPVCRILDYGKFLYEESKKKKDSKPHAAKLKEVKFRVGIDTHDFETKLRHAEQFLFDGNKVKLNLTFRGREMEHKELGFERMKAAVKELEHVGHPDSDSKLVGRNITVIMSPLPTSRRKLKFNQPEAE